MRKKIVVNTRFLIQNKMEGIGWFTFETMKRITVKNPDIDFYFLFDRKYSNEFIFSGNIIPIVLFPPARHPILWYIWFEFSVGNILRKIKPDLFFSPDGFLNLRTNVPTIPVIHDLAFEHYPEDVLPLVKFYYKKYFPLYARKATRIMTVSEFSKNDINKKYFIDNARIDVVYSGVKNNIKLVNEENQEITLKTKYSSGFDYFIYVGAIHPRKNILRMIQAFELFKRNTNSANKLILVGKKSWGNSELDDLIEISNYKNDIVFTGYVNNEDLYGLIKHSSALLFISYFEGFGVPPLEGMKLGVPVIASNVSSIPEISGDAALYVNPFSIESISDGMCKIVGDNNLRNHLIKMGNERFNLFTWDKTSDLVWNSIEKVLKK